MWKSRRKSNNEIITANGGGSIRRSFSNLNFIHSSLKDIETLLAEDQPPPATAATATTARRLSIFHRVHLANKFARAFTKPNTNSPTAAFTLPAAAAAAVQLSKSDRQISTETEKLGKSDRRISVPVVATVQVTKSDRQITFPVETTAVTNLTKSDRRISNPTVPMTKSDRQITFPVETSPAITKLTKSDRRISIPGSETRIIVYTTSLRVIRSTFEACRTVQSILRGFRVSIDERDLSMDSKFLDELHDVMAVTFENNDLIEKSKLSLPKVFIGGRYIGGVEEVRQLHESGELKKIVDGLPAVTRGVCESCGDFRFVLCDECSGSHKCYSEKSGFRCCNLCNENGLVRCPLC